MNQPFTVACIQNTADDDLDLNIAQADGLVRRAAAADAALVCLPECFSFIGRNEEQTRNAAGPEAGNRVLGHFRALAAELDLWLLLGSIMVPAAGDKVHNRSYLLDAAGEIAARYDKLHLFDVTLSGGESYRESNYVAPGANAVTCTTPWGVLGLSICYDVRFAHLYRALAKAGAEFISIPAAFTHTTGAAHWHTLVRARAIECGCFVFAPAQCGTRPWGRATYGHSLIVDPWGRVLADGGEHAGLITARIDPSLVARTRERIPSLRHDREFEVQTAAHGTAHARGTGTEG